MREPFSGLLPRGERLVAAGEVDLAMTRGPLAMPAEIAAFLSPLLSIVLAVRLDGATAKALGAVLPPLVLILLARYPLRRWRRPREWIGVTDRRALRWWRPASLFVGPRIEELPLHGVVGVELDQDDWDRRTGTHHLTLHTEIRTRSLGRLHNAERLRDAIVVLVRSASPPAVPGDNRPAPAPPPGDFVPPAAPPADYRP